MQNTDKYTDECRKNSERKSRATKDIESLKESIQFSDEQVALVKKENEELVQKNNPLENKVYDLGLRVRNLEFDHDALEQYTRKFNVRGARYKGMRR